MSHNPRTLSTPLFSLLLVSPLFFVQCGGGTSQRNTSNCAADADFTIDGKEIPISNFEFRNAFDPSDTAVYDPSEVDALPGPLMVDAWGQRGEGAHGTLGVFPPGFSAPLHTHTNAYDGVVLRGKMTNPFGADLEKFLDGDDSNNHGDVVLEPGSYWHVPSGSQHTTTCIGPEVCWFYFHAENAFDFAPFVDESGALLPGVTLEAPHADSILTTRAMLEFAGEEGSFVQFAPAWGNMNTAAHGTFGLFDKGALSPLHTHSQEYFGIVIEGEVSNPFNSSVQAETLATGGYWQVPANAVHKTGCAEGSDCLFYFHSRSAFDFTPVCEE